MIDQLEGTPGLEGIVGGIDTSAFQWILAKEPEQVSLPVPLIEDLLINQEYLRTGDKNVWLRRHLLVSPEKILEVTFLTKGQRVNLIWSAVRRLRFTASNFGQIISAAKRSRQTTSLKKRITSAYNLEKRAPIQWRTANEKEGIKTYSRGGGVDVIETGIWLHESGILGASPDGFVQGEFNSFSNIHLQRIDQPMITPDIVEVKCPFSAKDMTLAEACSVKGDPFNVKFTHNKQPRQMIGDESSSEPLTRTFYVSLFKECWREVTSPRIAQ